MSSVRVRPSRATRAVPVRCFHASSTRYDNKNVLYIAYVGTYDSKETFKYGKSSNLLQRIQAHQKAFHTFDLKHVYKTDFNDYVEDTFEKELKLRNIYTQCIIKDKKQTELFQLSDTYSLADVDKLMRKIIKEYDLTERRSLEYEREKLRVQKLQLTLQIKELDYKILALKKSPITI